MVNLVRRKQQIIRRKQLIWQYPTISTAEIAILISMSPREVEKHNLKTTCGKILKRIIAEKAGYWEVLQ